ncbi:MAG: hypothetical protein JSS86_08005 [Cyanobacteria bacterium SZAS LIN-2]|nr:hypothetical protein [Cyanobacteria bacterium SZAS LIN-3]MBS1996237.1 hypothetical protein [Cyanobacteria bacterium SZAS LIN-2]
MDSEFDPEFKKRLRRLITERLAREAVEGGSWKNALEQLKDIFDIDPAEVEREIASFSEMKSWEESPGSDSEAADEKTGKKDRAGKKKSFFSFGRDKDEVLSGVRDQVFEVVVRQGMAGAPWREICAGPMRTNSIDPDDVQKEIDRRKKLLK